MHGWMKKSVARLALRSCALELMNAPVHCDVHLVLPYSKSQEKLSKSRSIAHLVIGSYASDQDLGSGVWTALARNLSM